MVAFLNILILAGILSGTAIPMAILPGYFINRAKKRSALRDYVRRLGRVLRVRHGLQESYDVGQVVSMMRKWGYSSAYDAYGLALYCSQSDFDAHYSTMAEPYDYELTRQELNSYLPFSRTDFSAADVVELGDRINRQGRAQKRTNDDIYDSSDLDSVSEFIRSNKGGDYGDNFEDHSSGLGDGGIPYGGGLDSFD